MGHRSSVQCSMGFDHQFTFHLETRVQLYVHEGFQIIRITPSIFRRKSVSKLFLFQISVLCGQLSPKYLHINVQFTRASVSKILDTVVQKFGNVHAI